MLNHPETEQAIRAGLTYLTGEQQPNGNFLSFAGSSNTNFDTGITCESTFTSSLILASLAEIQDTQAGSLRSRLAKFLLSQKSPGWSFNYWIKGSKQYEAMPYPDDLDDTFCALIGLVTNDSSSVSEAALANIIRLLIANETATGGPYRTWLVSSTEDKVWLDVDLAVNSNIAYFISLVSRPLPNVVELIDRAIQDDRLQSPYYPSVYPIAYYISRGYAGNYKQKLINKLQQLQLQATTALDKALCFSSLIRLGETAKSETAITELIELQQSNGSWPAAAFFLDPGIDKKTSFQGSSALTTAMVVEALGINLPVKQLVDIRTTKTRDTQFQIAVKAMATKRCQYLSDDLRGLALESINKLGNSSNGPGIISFAYHFNRSLIKPLPASHINLLKELGVANLYGWLAYTIYDDFLDDEGSSEMLPVANVALRRSLEGFLGAIPKNQELLEMVHRTFDTIDGANAWELANCRLKIQGDRLSLSSGLPNYGKLTNLAERSLGHTLGPLSILLAVGYTVNSKQFKQIQKALKHYLIARQLNDDAHDWEADLQNGHISYVVSQVLALEPTATPTSMLKALPVLRRNFWNTTLLGICDEMQRQVDLSRQALRASLVVQSSNVVSKLLDDIELSIQETRIQQSQAKNFLKHYVAGA